MASMPESNTMEAEEAEVTSVRQCPTSRRAPPPSPAPPAEIEVEFPLVRQSSIYSLTLDEIQNTVCEPGKSFGSMNMDEFLTNIWNVEEGFDAAAGAAQAHHAAAGGPAPPLNRQGSLSLPSPLCRKTVDEVWSEIRREQKQGRQLQVLQQQHQSRKPTFGEMTLEDFLIKAGVVREGYGPTAGPSPKPLPRTPAAAPPQYGLTAGYSVGAEVAPGFSYGGGPEENGRRGEVYCYGSGGGGMQMGMVGSPGSPVSSDGMCEGGGQLDVYGFGMDGVLEGKNGGGRKRVAEGTMEKVVERRQRRMIKNRESAARSRARKQAYTVELEAELNHLKEENARLREEERRVRHMRKQMILEAMAEQARSNMNKTCRTLRRCHSSPT